MKNEIWHQEVDFFCQSGIRRLSLTSVLKMLLGEENHSSPVVYRGGMVFLPYRCLSDTLTPVFPFDSFINGSLENGNSFPIASGHCIFRRMKIPSMDGETSYMDKSAILGCHQWMEKCHPWMEKCHPWMEVSSLDVIHE